MIKEIDEIYNLRIVAGVVRIIGRVSEQSYLFGGVHG